jgi:hypothetical protein
VDPVVEEFLADRVQSFDQSQLGLGVLRLLLLLLKRKCCQRWLKDATTPIWITFDRMTQGIMRVGMGNIE